MTSTTYNWWPVVLTAGLFLLAISMLAITAPLEDWAADRDDDH